MPPINWQDDPIDIAPPRIMGSNDWSQLYKAYGGSDGAHSGPTIYTSTTTTYEYTRYAVYLAVWLIFFFITMCRMCCCEHKPGHKVLQEQSAATTLTPASPPQLNNTDHPLLPASVNNKALVF